MSGPTTFTSRVLVIPFDNIDTDQIVPARFMKTLSKQGLGAQLFFDWRYDPDGRPKPDFVLNRPDAASSSVLVAGQNFGCGSSREHAAWALTQFGIRAVVSNSFADIFKQNALKNGLLPIVVPDDVHTTLLMSAEAKVTVDLVNQTLTTPERVVPFSIDSFSKYCLLAGLDEVGYILQQDDAILAFEARQVRRFDTRS